MTYQEISEHLARQFIENEAETLLKIMELDYLSVLGIYDDLCCDSVLDEE